MDAAASTDENDVAATIVDDANDDEDMGEDAMAAERGDAVVDWVGVPGACANAPAAAAPGAREVRRMTAAHEQTGQQGETEQRQSSDSEMQAP